MRLNAMTKTPMKTKRALHGASPPSASSRLGPISTPLRWAALAGGVLLIVVHFLCLGRYPSLGGDEVYFSPTAYSLVTHGVFARTIHPGPAGFSVRDYFPPVITLLMAGSYELFGFGGWQTRLVTLLCGLAAAFVLFFLVKRMTGNLKAALLACAVFAVDPEVVHSWQTGHYESVFELVAVLTLYLGVLSLSYTGRRLVGIWGLAGVSTALLAITYYPFALPGWLISLLMLRALLWQGREVDAAQKRRATAAFGIGALLVFGPFLWHVSVNPHLFRLQIIDQLGIYSGAAHGGGAGIVHTILSEPSRYFTYMVKDFGLIEVALNAAAVFILLRARRQGSPPGEQDFRPLVLGSIAIWLGFLFFYGAKEAKFFGDVAPYSACAVALAWLEVSRQRGDATQAAPAGRAFLSLTALCLAVGTGLVGLIGYTVLRQWGGRDYPAFARMLTSVIPPGVNVVGPQSVWYALAPQDHLRLYTVGGEQIEGPTGTSQLNDLQSLRSVDYVVLPADEFSGLMLNGLVANVHSHFTFVRRVRVPCVLLPWSKTAPYDVDVYVKRRA